MTQSMYIGDSINVNFTGGVQAIITTDAFSANGFPRGAVVRVSETEERNTYSSAGKNRGKYFWIAYGEGGIFQYLHEDSFALVD